MAVENSIRGIIGNFEKLGKEEVIKRLEKIFSEYYIKYTKDYDQNCKDSIRAEFQRQLDKKINEFEKEKEAYLKSHLPFNAADRAVAQAIEAAETGSMDNYTRTQLVRTIGVIWSAALGAKIIGSDELNKPSEEPKN